MQFFAAEFIEVVLHDAGLGRVFATLGSELSQQALGERSCCHAWRIEFLHPFQHAFDVQRHHIELGCDIIHAGAQVSSGIQVSDEFHGDLGILPRPRGGAELLQ